MRVLSRPLLAALAVVLAVALPAVLAACGGGSASPAPAASPDKVTLQLNWFHEAEFVGYYVAAAKGFYGASDLDVTILEGGPGDPAIDHVLDGRSDFAISSFGEQRDAVAEDLPTVARHVRLPDPPARHLLPGRVGHRQPGRPRGEAGRGHDRLLEGRAGRDAARPPA